MLLTQIRALGGEGAVSHLSFRSGASRAGSGSPGSGAVLPCPDKVLYIATWGPQPGLGPSGDQVPVGGFPIPTALRVPTTIPPSLSSR